MFHKVIFFDKNSADCFANMCLSSGFSDVEIIPCQFITRFSVLVFWEDVAELQTLINLQGVKK